MAFRVVLGGKKGGNAELADGCRGRGRGRGNFLFLLGGGGGIFLFLYGGGGDDLHLDLQLGLYLQPFDFQLRLISSSCFSASVSFMHSTGNSSRLALTKTKVSSRTVKL